MSLPTSSLLSIFIYTLMLITITNALKCHVIPYGNLTDPNQITTATSLQECPFGANTCFKTIDYSRGGFSKTCQINNCTTQTGQTQAAANCFNSTSNGVLMSTCCCYGDGCNSSPSQFGWPSLLFIILLSMLIIS